MIPKGEIHSLQQQNDKQGEEQQNNKAQFKEYALSE